MKVLLVAINSKYAHTSLSVRSLSRNAGDVPFCEFTINDRPDHIISEVYKYAPDIICFSCYIWNIEIISKIASSLKKALPECMIVLGGPEVSYSPVSVLEKMYYADAVICGEGEYTFKILIEHGFDFDKADGVVYRCGNEIINKNKLPDLVCLDSLVFPYTDEDLEKNKGKLIYYESSRGCPYNCSYCISSTIHSVRFKSVEKVKNELKILIKHKPKTIKFVDRTFNADIRRTCELIRFMIEEGKGVVFHFEISAHTLNDEFLSLMENAPGGMFRLEVGLQSTNPETIKAINRTTDFEKLSQNVKRLTASSRAHIHLDLIAGLPKEDLCSFINSFNDAMSLKPNVMQLGFLKLLDGTEIKRDYEKYGYRFSDYPPYEVISNNFISYSDIILLKEIEETVDKIYNSGAFKNYLEYTSKSLGDYFEMYRHISKKLKNAGFYDMSLSRGAVYEALAEDLSPAGLNYLKLDYFFNNINASTPSWSAEKYDTELHKKRVDIITNYRDTVFSDFSGQSINEILKNVHFEVFSYDVLKDGSRRKNILVFTKSGKFLGEIIG